MFQQRFITTLFFGGLFLVAHFNRGGITYENKDMK